MLERISSKNEWKVERVSKMYCLNEQQEKPAEAAIHGKDIWEQLGTLTGECKTPCSDTDMW